MTVLPNVDHPIRYERTFRRLVADTTINTETLLSTDYLNHYNEVVMLLDLVPEMPEMVEDVCAWVPKTYQEHFRDSVFSHRDLAIAAYEHAPVKYRGPMDQVTDAMDAAIADGLPRLRAAADAGDAVTLASLAAELAEELRGNIARTSAIINGYDEAEVVAAPEDTTFDQDDIDALFD